MSIVTPTALKTAATRGRKTAIHFIANLFITGAFVTTYSRLTLIMVATVALIRLTFLEWSATTFRPC